MPAPTAFSDPAAESSANPDSPRIFLCYSKKDREAVLDLRHRLCIDGFNPWLDEKDLVPGQDWDLEIHKAIRTSAAVLVCLSRFAVSNPGYIHKEILKALDRANHQPEGAIFIIPVRLEGCEVPERLKIYQWVNLYETDGYALLLKALVAKGPQ